MAHLRGPFDGTKLSVSVSKLETVFLFLFNNRTNFGWLDPKVGVGEGETKRQRHIFEQRKTFTQHSTGSPFVFQFETTFYFVLFVV